MQPAPGEPHVEATDWRLVDFLLRLRADQATGREQPLSHYLAAYPEHEDAVAREYLFVRALDREAAAVDAAARTFGPYQLLHELGRGAQGVVWLAHDPLLGRDVAVKILHRTPADELAEARFLRAASAAAKLDHPNLCRVFGAGREGQSLWIAMQALPGPSLAARLAAAARAHAAPDLRAQAKLAAALARGLQHAHERGIVHRDVKPANVLLAEDGAPVLSDFGLARDLDGGLPSLTATADLRGTPAYLAPELLRGAQPGPSADVFALGVLAYECCTLTHPFPGPSHAAIAQAILAVEPWSQPAFTALPPDLRAVLATALAKEPGDRYASAGAFAADLEAFAAGQPVAARRPGPWRRARAWARAHRALAAVVAGTALLLASATAVSLVFLQRERTLRTAAQEWAGREHALRAAAQESVGRTRAVARSLLFEIHGALRDVLGAVGVRVAMLEKARDALQELHALDPRDVETRHDLAMAWMRLGDVHGHGAIGNRGDRELARSCYEKSAELARAGAAQDARFTYDLAAAYSRLGDLAIDEKDAARPLYEKSLELARSCGDGPDQRSLRGSVLASLAQLDRTDGDLDGALARAVLAERELSADEADVARRADLAGVRLVRATILQEKRQLVPAAELLRAVTADLEELRAAEPRHLLLLARLASTCVALARLEVARGEPKAGLSAADRAVALRRERAAADAQDRGALHDLAQALSARSEVRFAAGDTEGCEADCREGLALAEDVGVASLAAELRAKLDALAR